MDEQVKNPEYHHWLKMGLAIRRTTEGLVEFCRRHGKAFYLDLLSTWTDDDRNAIKHASNRSGSEYKSSEPSQQRKDFAEAITRRHVNKAAKNPNFSNCDASRWGDDDAYFEVLKAYILMKLGPHQECIQIRDPDQLDMSALTAIMQFCDGFSHCVDQHSTALPEGHAFRVDGTTEPSGSLEAARNVRNRWAHSSSQQLTIVEAKHGINTLLQCLKDNTASEGGIDTLLNDDQAKENAVELQLLLDSLDDPGLFPLAPLLERAVKQDHEKVLAEIKRAQAEDDTPVVEAISQVLQAERAALHVATQQNVHAIAAVEDPRSLEPAAGEGSEFVSSMKNHPESDNRSTDPGQDHSRFTLAWDRTPLDVEVHRVWFDGSSPTRVMLRGSCESCLPVSLQRLGWALCNSTLNIPKSIDVLRFALLRLRDHIKWKETRRAELFVNAQKRQKCFVFEGYMDTSPECRERDCWLLADLSLKYLPELELKFEDAEADYMKLPEALVLRRASSAPMSSKEEWLRDLYDEDPELFPEPPPENLNSVKPDPRAWWEKWRPFIKGAAASRELDYP